MPKTKRNKVISLTKTSRKTRDDKSNMMDTIRSAADEFAYVWLFSIGNMRNSYLKEVRSLWAGSRIFFGKNRVMAKAMGENTETELKKGLSGISQRLTGSVGLLFTDSPPAEVSDWFETHERKDFARSGNVAIEDVILSHGPISTIGLNENEPLAGSLEPQLRKLGMPTELQRGVPSLRQEFTVCKKGKRIDTNAAQILKHLAIQQASFRIVPLAYYDSSKEDITEIKLTPEQTALVQQANGKDNEAAPGERKGLTRKRKDNHAKKVKKAAQDGQDDEDDDQDMDDDDDDDDDEDDDDIDVEDKVTDDMMLPAHLK
ncbi:unnamed protein product [Sympodiomycopsis kandeliae]